VPDFKDRAVVHRSLAIGPLFNLKHRARLLGGSSISAASGATGFLRTLVFGGTGGPLGSSGVAEAGVEVSFAALKLERSAEMGKV
jgi:hypothetical protein